MAHSGKSTGRQVVALAIEPTSRILADLANFGMSERRCSPIQRHEWALAIDPPL